MKKLLVVTLIILMSFSNFGFVATPVSASQEPEFLSDNALILPILMYHKVLKSKKGKYTIHPDQLEKDFIAIKEAGFETVFMSEVIDWVDDKGTLPNKPIVITFDDGQYNNLFYGLEIARRHNMKIVLNPVTSFSKFSTDSGDHSNPNYSHMTWTQMKEAVDTGLVEFGNHTHNMHKFKPRFGVTKKSGESMEEYTKVLKKDIQTAQDLMTQAGVPTPTSFAYPFGKYSKESKSILLDMGFRALLTCNEGVNTLKKGDETTLHSLRRHNRDGWMTTDEVICVMSADPKNNNQVSTCNAKPSVVAAISHPHVSCEILPLAKGSTARVARGGVCSGIINILNDKLSHTPSALKGIHPSSLRGELLLPAKSVVVSGFSTIEEKNNIDAENIEIETSQPHLMFEDDEGIQNNSDINPAASFRSDSASSSVEYPDILPQTPSKSSSKTCSQSSYGLNQDSLDQYGVPANPPTPSEPNVPESKPAPTVKWVEFNASSTIINRAQKAHKQFVEKEIEDIGTVELLAYLAVKNGNNFNTKRDTVKLNNIVSDIKEGSREEFDKYKDNRYFHYYTTAFHAVLDGIIDPKTGIAIGFHPIAKGHWHTGYDDFGNSRSFGFKRRHLGHDLFGGIGTPIIAVEGGTVTELGWNRYGGWRVGIRSEDTKRYYYYAHLRRNKPFPEDLKLGDTVNAGDVIGYLGNTGYSSTPNQNMKSTRPHLHFGMQLIFTPDQEDGNNEIWIDVYQICKFLESHKKTVEKGVRSAS